MDAYQFFYFACIGEEITALYRACWQIQLFFKLCKSEAKLDATHGKTGNRCLVEIYAKMVGILIANWLMLKRFG
ncbi:MAG: hypothetical protein LBU65_06030 [Planctomycetaceae bacterium]|nr:hypothetical protein [Planctomycetaceae bacterium]